MVGTDSAGPAMLWNLKGSLLVSKTWENAVRVGLIAVLAAGGLLVGCTPRESTVDTYLDAVMLRELGQDELAAKKLTAVVAADPDFTMAHSELGKAYRKLGKDEKAMVAFRRAARLDPWSFETHMNLAETCRKVGNYPEAAAAYARAVELDATSVDAIIGAAQCFLETREYTRTVTYCEQAEEAGESPPQILRLKAQAYEGRKDYEQAIEVYEQLASQEGEKAESLLPLAVACMKAGQLQRARSVLISVTQMQPQDGVAFRHLGYCLVKLGETDEAIGAYEKATACNDGDWEAHSGLGVAYMMKARRTGDAELGARALDEWRRSLRIAPDQPRHDVLERLIRQNPPEDDPLQGLNE